MRKFHVAVLMAAAVVISTASPSAARRHAPGITFACDDRYPHLCGPSAMAMGRPFDRVAPRAVLGGASLHGVAPPLAAKAREIVVACRARVISAVRHTFVAGTRTLSLHASGRAVDIAGNPGCIYARLAAWPGGYSTDYGRVGHVHISFGGREDGRRFAHRSKRKHVNRRRT